MKQIAIYGAGGFCREVACLLNKINEVEPIWELVFFFDDSIEKGTQVSHFGIVLGGIDELNVWPTEVSIAITIGNPKIVQHIIANVTNPNIQCPNIIAPTVYFADPEIFKIGKGNIIQKHCGFSCDVTIGDFNVMDGADVFVMISKSEIFGLLYLEAMALGIIPVGLRNVY